MSWHHGRVELDELGAAIWQRVTPSAAPEPGWWILAAAVAALIAVVLPPLWRYARLAVTIVHELGHAAVGILVGRRFTGFVVSSDMSGHAVTVGPRRGAGRILSTWAGYPAPAVLGAASIQIALHGWSRTALFAAAFVLVGSLVFTRSLHTALTVLVTAAGLGAAWWWGGQELSALITLAVGVFLLLGAWRHLGAVVTSGRAGDDPGQLARLTRVPAWVWNLTFLLVIGGCTWWSWTAIGPHLL